MECVDPMRLHLKKCINTCPAGFYAVLVNKKLFIHHLNFIYFTFFLGIRTFYL
jgi:hypothetical protein